MRLFAMARRTPDVASCLGSGDVSCKMEESGAFRRLDVQNRGPASAARPVPRNFVWRLGGGRHVHTGGSADRNAMAVDVPVLRECFDPWNHHQQADAGDGSDGQDGRCRGCGNMVLKAKARAAAAAKPPLPHAPTHSKCHGFVHVGAWCLFISIGPNSAPRSCCSTSRQAPAAPRQSPGSPQEKPQENPPRARGVPSRPDGTHPCLRQAAASDPACQSRGQSCLVGCFL